MEWQPRTCRGKLGILSQEQSQKNTLHFYGYPTSILWGKKLRSESDLPVVTLQNMAALGSGRGENSSQRSPLFHLPVMSLFSPGQKG